MGDAFSEIQEYQGLVVAGAFIPFREAGPETFVLWSKHFFIVGAYFLIRTDRPRRRRQPSEVLLLNR
jgi:hypothetical protein